MDDLEAIYKRNAELALIREFAGRALTGLLHGENEFEDETMRRNNWRGFCQTFAESAFDYADAMLTEYKKRYGVE